MSWKGLSGRDAARAARAMDGPSWRAPGAAPERGDPGKAGAGCRGGLSFALLFFAQTKKSEAPCKAQPVVPSRGKRGVQNPDPQSQKTRASPARTRRPPGSYKNISRRARHNRTPPMRDRCIASRMHPTVVSRSRPQQLGFCFSASLSGFATPKPSAHTTRPFSRPSAGVVEGVERQGCRESREGHGWPFVACPWNGTGAREPRQSRGRMQGSPSLWLLSLGETRESDAPCRAQSVVRAEESATPKTPDRKAKRQEHRPQAGSYKNISRSARHNRTPPNKTGALLRECTLRLSRSRSQQRCSAFCFATPKPSGHTNSPRQQAERRCRGGG